MTELQTLANLAEIFGAITVSGGVAFAIVQIHQFRKRRLDAACVDLVHTFQSPEFIRALRLIRALPDGVSVAELCERGTEYEEATGTIGITFEAIGLLVFRRVVPFAVVRDLAGDTVLFFWTKLSKWAEEVRLEQSQESVMEWFQWLAERLQEDKTSTPDQPAYKKFRGWKPRRQTTTWLQHARW